MAGLTYHKWIDIESGISKVLSGNMDIQTYIGLYLAIYKYCAPNKTVKFKLGSLYSYGLFWTLTLHLRRHLQNLLQVLQACSDEALVAQYVREWDRYTQSARCNDSLFRPLNHGWIRREIDRGRQDIYQILELHLVQWSSVIDAIIMEKLRSAVLTLLLTKKGGDLLKHPQIMPIIDSFDINRPSGGARLVCIAARPLAESDGNPEAASSEPIGNLIRADVFQSSRHLVLAGSKHWSLLILCKNGRWTLFEMVKERGNNMTLRKLHDEEIRLTRKCYLFPVGYTFLDDDHIMELAEAIPLRRGENYNLILNNCQTFCRLLFLCIRIPFSPYMVFEAFPAIPHKFSDQVIRRQLREYEISCLYGPDIVSMPLPETLPVSIEMALAVVCRLALVALVSLALMGFYRWLALLAMFIAAPYARLDVLRLLSKYVTAKPDALQLYRILHSDVDGSDLKAGLNSLSHRTLNSALYGSALYPSTPPTRLFSSIPRFILAASLERFHLTRDIGDVPVGLDYEDVVMASMINPPDEAELEAFLALDDPREQREYQIGLAFVGSRGHAEIVLRDGDLSTAAPPKNLDLTSQRPTINPHKFVPLGDGRLRSADKMRIRVLHVRNAARDTGNLELALEAPPRGSIQFYRHADLYRIRTTERQLRQIALRSCPAKYCLVIDDCATFAYNFLNGLLYYLKSRGSISEEEYFQQRVLLLQHNHVRNGVVGRSEVASRASRSASGNM